MAWFGCVEVSDIEMEARSHSGVADLPHVYLEFIAQWPMVVFEIAQGAEVVAVLPKWRGIIYGEVIVSQR